MWYIIDSYQANVLNDYEGNDMKNVQELHKAMIAKAKEVAAKHDMHAALASGAKHTDVDYTAKFTFIEKDDVNRDWTSDEALYRDNSKFMTHVYIVTGKKINLQGREYVVIGLKSNRANSKVVLRNNANRLVLVDNNTTLDVALTFAK